MHGWTVVCAAETEFHPHVLADGVAFRGVHKAATAMACSLSLPARPLVALPYSFGWSVCLAFRDMASFMQFVLHAWLWIWWSVKIVVKNEVKNEVKNVVKNVTDFQ